MTGSRSFDVVLCDNDGCLVAETNEPFDLDRLGAIAAHNLRAIADADRPVVTVCSGRPHPFVEAMCRLIANTAVPTLAENGAWLYDPRHNDFHLDPAISPEHIDMVRSAQQWCMQTFGDRPLAVEPGKTAMFSLYSPDPAVVPEITPAIRDGFAQHGWDLRVSQSVAYLNCDLAHISKATGIDRFVAHTGIPTSRLAGIGDTIGDMAIRERVAFFACPANADQRLKDVADYISPHEHAAGVVDILTQL